VTTIDNLQKKKRTSSEAAKKSRSLGPPEANCPSLLGGVKWHIKNA